MSKYSATLNAVRQLSERLPSDNGGDLAKTSRALIGRIESAAATLENLHSAPDPMLSQLAIKMRVDNARSELKKIVSEGRSQSTALLAQIRANVELQQAQTANLQPSPHAQEIRSVFRQMTMTEKLQFLSDAIDQGDGPVVASLVTVPSVLTGLTPEQTGLFKKAYVEKAAPVDVTSIDATEEVVTAVLSCAGDLVGTA